MTHRLSLGYGPSDHLCPVKGRNSSFSIPLRINVVPLQHGPAAITGSLHIRRQQIDDNLGLVVENALQKKVPKLANTAADKRVLILERQHMNLFPKAILDEVERQRASFPDFAKVDEIWILEAIGTGSSFFGTYLRFVLYDGNIEAVSYDFDGGKLIAAQERDRCFYPSL